MIFNNFLSIRKICGNGYPKEQADVIGPVAFTCHNVDGPMMPVLLSVPHAGRDYPAELLANLRVAAADLIRLEDRYADRLVQSAIAAGYPVIVAQRARAWIDLNRAETDIDFGMLSDMRDHERPATPSAKARGGLGLFPRRLQACGELWQRPMTADDANRRIEHYHRPYHRAVSETLQAMRARFGIAVLIDVHSMPPLPAHINSGSVAGGPPNLVVGDRFGRSAASIYAELAMARGKAAGMETALNSPYSGDYILQIHGNPRNGVHAVQLEIDRSHYLDSQLREPTADLKAIARLVLAIASDFVDQSIGRSFAEAAE